MQTREKLLTIGEVAARLGLTTSTLRYWEERGVLQPAARRSGRRLYGPEELRRIALIQIWQGSGTMSLDEIAIVLAGRTETGHWRDTVRGRMAAIDGQIDRLTQAKAYLAHYLNCPRDHPADDCPMVSEEVEAHFGHLP
ncbi:MerR family transcriptional regulator [Streptantibioticus ferralitis]|uniref:MerR family transcriptional regulator n=1 Tax=Streptantibioticus ferralitis TaxID=236510 RepID=A0ABT5Z1R4_9ACTN|nr:MerR family transcriptional regulator [Streptantibioticus ferralitis]MDF2257765.1 MerR family transcriptional regulator [Streptantibioticus ferralitis]